MKGFVQRAVRDKKPRAKYAKNAKEKLKRLTQRRKGAKKVSGGFILLNALKLARGLPRKSGDSGDSIK
jgi:hypothetical protein